MEVIESSRVAVGLVAHVRDLSAAAGRAVCEFPTIRRVQISVATVDVHVCAATTCSCSPRGVTGSRRREIVPPCSVASRCFALLRPFGRLRRPGPDLRAAAESHLSSAAPRSRRATSQKHPDATCPPPAIGECGFQTLPRVAHKMAALPTLEFEMRTEIACGTFRSIRSSPK